MDTQVLTLVLGPMGTLVVLCVIAWAFSTGKLVSYQSYKREADRVDRLDEISTKAMEQTERVVSQTGQALINHARLFENQQRVLDLLAELRGELEHAKEREQWNR